MKKILITIFLALCAMNALAQYISPSQLAPHWGYPRKGPCGAGFGDNCGSNPPTWHITPDQCGTLYSTSNARNADNSVSTQGVRFTLPLVSELTAAGYNASGASGAGGFTNRDGQCVIHFVIGGPSPDNYLRLGINGVQGVDKLTILQGASSHDIFDGDAVFHSIASCVMDVIWNGTSWLATGCPAWMEQINGGQMWANGQGRLFMVTADPTWWTVGSKIGSIAYCPINGRGMVGEVNGAVQLGVLPINCFFRDTNVGTATEWLVTQYIGSINAASPGIEAGAAYLAGTAPNGVAYAAGNYISLHVATVNNLSNGNTIELHNLPTTLGSVVNGKWIIKVLTAPVAGCSGSGSCLELHESVQDFGNLATSEQLAVGPPSSYTATDTIRNTVTLPTPVGSYWGMTNVSIGVDRLMNPIAGMEFGNSASHTTLIGIARKTGGVYADALNNRALASFYNPMLRPCMSTYTASRTTASLTFAEPNTEIRCNFVYLNRASSPARLRGDTGDGLRWAVTATMSNATNADGCELTVGFDGTTPEAPTGKVMNPAATNGNLYSVTVTGVKMGLTETNHFITLLARAITGGTCTIDSVGTSVTAFLMQ
jgi:hypothetical protein